MMRNAKQTSVWFSEPLLKELEKIQQQTGLSLSEVIRGLVIETINKRRWSSE